MSLNFVSERLTSPSSYFSVSVLRAILKEDRPLDEFRVAIVSLHDAEDVEEKLNQGLSGIVATEAVLVQISTKHWTQKGGRSSFDITTTGHRRLKVIKVEQTSPHVLARLEPIKQSAGEALDSKEKDQ